MITCSAGKPVTELAPPGEIPIWPSTVVGPVLVMAELAITPKADAVPRLIEVGTCALTLEIARMSAEKRMTLGNMIVKNKM
tara:strand:- start:6535 stop:6777 length:243 start_codon:yes stop_codon:yes gene_type:complete